MAELPGLLARFGLAGLANTVVGFAVIAALDAGLGVEKHLANAAGYAVGIGLGFVLNRGFVFRSEAGARATAPKYLAAIAIAFCLNQLVLTGAGAVLGPERAMRLAAQLLAMASYTALQFVLFRAWVFRKP